MAFIIRHKETGRQLFTSYGKKGSWKTAAHAKSAFCGVSPYDFGRQNFERLPKYCNYFDEQDVFEIVEVVEKDKVRYCFVTDGDAGRFLIPVELKEAFHTSLANGEADGCAEFNNSYGQYSIDSMTNWTFTDPKEDA